MTAIQYAHGFERAPKIIKFHYGGCLCPVRFPPMVLARTSATIKTQAATDVLAMRKLPPTNGRSGSLATDFAFGAMSVIHPIASKIAEVAKLGPRPAPCLLFRPLMGV